MLSRLHAQRCVGSVLSPEAATVTCTAQGLSWRPAHISLCMFVRARVHVSNSTGNTPLKESIRRTFFSKILSTNLLLLSTSITTEYSTGVFLSGQGASAGSVRGRVGLGEHSARHSDSTPHTHPSAYTHKNTSVLRPSWYPA